MLQSKVYRCIIRPQITICHVSYTSYHFMCSLDNMHNVQYFVSGNYLTLEPTLMSRLIVP